MWSQLRSPNAETLSPCRPLFGSLLGGLNCGGSIPPIAQEIHVREIMQEPLWGVAVLGLRAVGTMDRMLGKKEGWQTAAWGHEPKPRGRWETVGQGGEHIARGGATGNL